VAAPPPVEDAARSEAEIVVTEPEPPPLRPPAAGRLRRERRFLARRREREIRDLGGLLLEMVRRDRFREDLLLERCAAVLELEQRIHDLDAMVASAVAEARGFGRGVVICRCGAPLPPNAHFCAHCGRPAPGPPIVACRHCGQPLSAESNFCAFCGQSVAAGDGSEEH